MIETTYIYTLSDPESGFVRYVGKTCDLTQRFKAHCSQKTPTYTSKWIFSLKKKNLLPVMEVVETLLNASDDEWQEAERFWIASFKQMEFRLTNLDEGGKNGKKPSLETRKKLSDSHKGYKPSLETRQKMKEALAKRTPETFEKIKQGIRRAYLNPAYKEKLSKASKGRKLTDIQRQARLGRKFSEETKSKISKALMGHLVTDEARKKMSAWQIGRVFTQEHRNNLSKAKIGHVITKETAQKISSAKKGKPLSQATRNGHKRYWEERRKL